MSLLAGKELHELIDAGVIDALHENVNASSIDVRLGDVVKFESDVIERDVDLSAKEDLHWRDYKMSEHGLAVRPGDFFLGHTVETFNLPDDISAEFKLRSSVARSGLQHMLAGWADAGFHDAQLTLEFKNVTRAHSLIIRPDMRIGQMVFYRHADAGENSYAVRGRYNGQKGVQSTKGVM